MSLCSKRLDACVYLNILQLDIFTRRLPLFLFKHILKIKRIRAIGTLLPQFEKLILSIAKEQFVQGSVDCVSLFELLQRVCRLLKVVLAWYRSCCNHISFARFLENSSLLLLLLLLRLDELILILLHHFIYLIKYYLFLHNSI